MKTFSYLTVILMTLTAACKQEPTSFEWVNQPNIPDEVGFAGSFAGISNNTLIVAGGANFPDGGAPWTGSTKVWHDQVFALESDKKEWKKVGKLPRALGYGVSVSTDEEMIIIGGSNEEGHYADVYRLEYTDGSVVYSELPSLPSPLANAAGVLLDHVIYVAGGTVEPTSPEAENNFWSLDLNDLAAGWQVLASWPGPSRMLAVVGATDDAVYLFSGAHLKDGVREYLSDGYKYSKDGNWTQLADLPAAVVAAPTPAYTSHEGELIIFGGDDGSLAGIDPQKDKHPGFSKTVISYDPKTNTWSEIATQPGDAAVTTSLVVWNGEVVIPGGEIRPAVRTTQVKSVIEK